MTCRAPRAIIPLKPGFVQRIIYQPGSIFQITIVIAIKKPIRKKSAIDFHFKIDPRFPDQNRIPIFILKSIRD